MEVCSVSEDIIKVENEIFANATDECLDITASSKTTNRVDHEFEERGTDESRRDLVLNNVTEDCHSPSEVPASAVKNEDNSITKSICKEFSGSDDRKPIDVPVSLSSVKDSFLLSDMHDNSENHTNNVLSEENGLHCEFLNSVNENVEKVLFELTDNSVSSSSRNIPCAEERERRTVSENNIYCIENNSVTILGVNDLNGVSDILAGNDETNTPLDEKTYRVSDVNKSRNCNDQKIEPFEKSGKNDNYESSVLDSFGESQILIKNNDDSDTVSGDEREVKGNKIKFINSSEATLGEMCMSGNSSLHSLVSHRQDTLSCSKESHTALPVSGPVLYKCINCSFSDWHLEKLTSHVIACVKKRKHVEGQESSHDDKPPTKARVLTTNKHLFPSKYKLSVVSNTESVASPQTEGSENKSLVPPGTTFSVVPKIEPSSQMPRIEQCVSLNPRFSNASNIDPLSLIQDQVPVSSKAQFNLSPQAQLVTSSDGQRTATQKIQLNNSPNTQFMVSPQAQLSDASNTVYAITPNTNFTSTSKPQLIINSPSHLIASKHQVVVPAKQNSILKPQITLTPESKLMPKVQPPITLQTQLSSSSHPQTVTTPKPQFPLVSGTKLTLGPHSPVPIMPQSPLTISPQGLTISQAGSQLLITTKLQPNTGGPNQPTLLGLGIGTNPSAAPKNIVLLPNILFNTVSTSSGNVNGKQTPGMIQGQFILQTPTTAVSSVAPVQLQQSLVYTPQTFTSQPQVLLSPLYRVTSNSLTAGIPKTTTTTSVVQQKSSLSLSQTKIRSKATSASTGTINPSGEQSSQSTSVLDKFICEICDDYVKDLVKLRRHMQCLHAIKIHPKMMPSFNCRKCQYCFFTEQGLERHLVGSHGLVTTGMQEAADKGKDSGRCPICGWGYQSKLLHHVATEHKICLKPADLSYKCTLCTATFGVYKQFEDHVYKEHRSAMTKHAQQNSRSSSSAIK